MLYLDHRRHLVPDKWYGGTSQTFQKTHVKERCGGGGVSGMGCGLWKTKGQPCPHCETRPNRSQAKGMGQRPRCIGARRLARATG